MRPLALLLLLSLAACSPVDLYVDHLESNLESCDFSAFDVEVGPAQVHGWRGGNGPPLLLLHGFGGDGLVSWGPQMQALAAIRTVVVPDLLWFGGSEAEGATPSLELQGRTFLGLMDRFGYERFDIAGISYGGFVTFQMAALEPERLRRTAIVASPGPAFSRQDHRELLARLGVSDPADLFVPTSPQEVPPLFEATFEEPPYVPSFLLDDLYRRSFAQHHRERRILLHDLEQKSSEWGLPLPSLPCERLVVFGEHDRVFPPSHGRELARRWDAGFVLIPESGHAVNAERPQALSEALVTFFEQATCSAD